MEFKWLTIPWSNRTKQIQVPQLWEVRWESRYGEYASSVKPEVEAFTTLEAAEEFALSLRRAIALLKHCGAGTEVNIRKAK